MRAQPRPQASQRRAEQAGEQQHDQHRCRSAGRSGRESARRPSAAWSGRAAPWRRPSTPGSGRSPRTAASGRAWRSAPGAAGCASTAARESRGRRPGIPPPRSSGAPHLGQTSSSGRSTGRPVRWLSSCRSKASTSRSAAGSWANGVAPAAQAGGLVVQFQAADAGVVVMAQLQARPVGPFLPFGLPRRTGQQAPVGDGQQALGIAQFGVQIDFQPRFQGFAGRQADGRPGAPRLGRDGRANCLIIL